jgi:chromosome segregation ATPase
MKRILYVLALAAVAGCAGMRGGARQNAPVAQVSDADFGRLAPGQMAPVDQARQFLASAKDEQGRAKLRQQDTMHEADLAKADQAAAASDAQRAEAQAKIANDSREPALLEQARQLREQAQQHKSAADAHADYAKRLAEARQASVKAADQQVALGEAKVEWAKLQALQQANIPAAGKYDAGQFQTRVNEAQKSFDVALQKARELEGQATASQQRWEELQKQIQARGGAVQTG